MGKGNGLVLEGSHNTYSPEEATEVSTPGFSSRISSASLLSGLRSKFRCPETSPPRDAQRGLLPADLLKAGVCFGAPLAGFP